MNIVPNILHIFSGFGIGGPQIRFVQLANYWGKRFGHTIIAMDGNLACAPRLGPNVDVAYPALSINKGKMINNIINFRILLQRLCPDVMITYNWGAIEWAIANTIPVVRHIHLEDGFGPEEQETQIRRRVLVRRAVLRRSTLVVPSKRLRRIAIEQWRLPPKRVTYIPNGIDCVRFSRAAGEETGSQPPGTGLVIGTVASLRPEKNLARLIRAFGQVVTRKREARLVIAGDGPELANLKELAATLGLAGKVRFFGQVADPRAIYRSFDVFALSSDTEQMPIAVLEAMAMELPVAATNVGDIADMVADENRRFITAADDGALAAALLNLLADGGLRRRVGEANRQKALGCYSEEAMCQAYSALIMGDKT